jgi:hypothetical protein
MSRDRTLDLLNAAVRRLEGTENMTPAERRKRSGFVRALARRRWSTRPAQENVEVRNEKT